MTERNRTRAFYVCLLAYFVIGCMVLTAQTILSNLINEFSWSNSRGGLLITCMSVGSLIMSVFGNILMDGFGRRNSLLLSSALIFISFLLFSTVQNSELFFIFTFFAGLAWGTINSLVNTVVSELYNGSAARLNIAHAAFSVGAVLFPLIVGFLSRQNITWRVPVFLVALLSAALFLCTLFTRMPERKGQAQESISGQAFPFWKEAGFYIATVTLFLYVGTENAASSWISGYLSTFNAFFRQIPAQTMVSLMWGMMLCGRLTVAAISTRLDRRILLIGLASCFLLGMTGLVLFPAVTPLVILSVVVMGLGMSAMYGTIVSTAQRYIAGPALAAGILYSGGGTGSAVMPILAGAISDFGGLRMGMASLCVILSLLLIMTVLGRSNEKRMGASI